MEVDPLNTPIKKIQALSIHSPDLKQIMVEKGYSNSISDRVLNELNLKLTDISNLPPKQEHVTFDSIHENHFSKMESIMNHYSIKRNTPEVNNTKKKRRTLTGIEESPVPMDTQKTTKSPTRRGVPNHSPSRFSQKLKPSQNQLKPSQTQPHPSLQTSFTNRPRLSPQKPHLPPALKRSPGTSSTTTPTVSPVRATGISPSKGSFNLNGMLSDKLAEPEKVERPDFKLPKTFTKIDHSTPQHVLQKKSSIPTLQKKPSIPTLQKKPSIPTLQKQPSSSSITPSLTKKSSIPTLQKKPSIPTLQKRPSTSSISSQKSPSSLSKRPSIPTLQKKPSIPTFHNSISSTPTFNYVQNPTLHFNGPSHPQTQMQHQTATTYAKPTISSSQKSLDRFTRFKNKFH